MGSCSPGDDRTPACPWETELIPCFALLSLSLLNCLHLNSRVFWLLPFQFESLPDPACGGVRKWLHSAWLLSGAKPWQAQNLSPEVQACLNWVHLNWVTILPFCLFSRSSPWHLEGHSKHVACLCLWQTILSSLEFVQTAFPNRGWGHCLDPSYRAKHGTCHASFLQSGWSSSTRDIPALDFPWGSLSFLLKYTGNVIIQTGMRLNIFQILE